MIMTPNGGSINVMDKRMPRIGETVYVLYGEELYVEKVFAIGAKEFILDSFRTSVEPFWLQNVEDKDRTWFYNLKDAAEELMSRYTDDYELVKYEKTWYGVRKL